MHARRGRGAVRAGPEHVRRLLRRSRADRSDVRAPTAGCARATSSPSTPTVTLTVVGRKKEIIIRGGMNIAPREIEELLVAFPEVERAAVVGLPDDRLGERACACVVLHPGAALDLETTVRPAASRGARHLQAARAARDPRRVADNGLGQGPEARDRAGSSTACTRDRHDRARAPPRHPRVDSVGDAACAVVALAEPAGEAQPDRLGDAARARRRTRRRRRRTARSAACSSPASAERSAPGGDLEKYITLQQDPVEFPHFVAELHAIFGRLRGAAGPGHRPRERGRQPPVASSCSSTATSRSSPRSARIGDGHLNFGQMGGGGVLTLLPRAIGRERAAELHLHRSVPHAEEAVAWGLVNRVVPDDDAARRRASSWRRRSRRRARSRWRTPRRCCSRCGRPTVRKQTGSRYERERNNLYCLTPDDAREGLAAFRGEAPTPVHRSLSMATAESERPRPAPDRESAAFWGALAQHRLLLQQCGSCGRHRFPPMPSCPWCGATAACSVRVDREWQVYSWVTVHRRVRGRVRGRRSVLDRQQSSSTRDAGSSAASTWPPARSMPGLAVEPVFVDHDGWTELRFDAERSMKAAIAGVGYTESRRRRGAACSRSPTRPVARPSPTRASRSPTSTES